MAMALPVSLQDVCDDVAARLRTNRSRVLLACLPAVLFAALATITAPKAKPKVKQSYLAQVAPDSFAARYGDNPLAITRVRTISITRELVATEPPVAAPPLPEAAPRPAPDAPVRGVRRTIRYASLDLCQRHGMRKVTTRGGRSWRCRR